MTPGYTESTYSLYEMAYYCNKMNYSAYIMDNRGQGRSSRLGCDEYQIYVEHFDDYVKDYNTFIETIVKPENKDLDIYGYGHSMGGLVVTRYTQMYPDTVNYSAIELPSI